MSFVKDYIYSILAYTAIAAALGAVMPNNSYRKYISFISGLALLDILIKPLMR